MNLSNTCWRFKDNIKSNIISYSGYVWDINFKCWGSQTTYSELDPYFFILPALYYDNITAFRNTTWIKESYKTIIILGGEEVTDTYLYSFLQAAAVQIPIVQTKVNGVWKYGQVNVKEGNWKLSKGLYVKDNTWIKK